MRPLYISIFIVSAILLFGSNVLNYIGIDENRFQLMMIALAMIPSLSLFKKWRNLSSLSFLLLFVVLFSFYELWTDKGEGTRVLLLSIIGAPAIITAFPTEVSRMGRRNTWFWRKVFKVFIGLYLAEVILVIIERAIGHPIFGWAGLSANGTIEMMGVMDFRSTGMYGHPLYNALMVSTAMAFIITSSLKPKYKFFLWGVGYFAILCFNTRGSIVGNALLLALYILYTVVMNRKMRSSTKSSIVVAGSVVAGFGYFMMSAGLVGGRLIKMGLVDDSSAQVRIDIIDFISKIDLITYLFGMSHEQYTNLLFMNQLSATENFWIDYLLRFGLLFLACYIFIYFLFLRRELHFYRTFHKWFVSLAFLLIASTNNSLSTSFVALFYFLLLIRLFNPPTLSKIVGKKYLS